MVGTILVYKQKAGLIGYLQEIRQLPAANTKAFWS